jgi:hypothetical protein
MILESTKTQSKNSTSRPMCVELTVVVAAVVHVDDEDPFGLSWSSLVGSSLRRCYCCVLITHWGLLTGMMMAGEWLVMMVREKTELYTFFWSDR